MADFEIAFKVTGRHEGGYSGVEDDNGNWTGGKKGVGHLVGTKYGFTAPELMAYLKRTPTVSEMKNLTIDIVKKVYKRDYWNVIRGDEIHNQTEANQMYDMAINAGPGTAIILAKRALGIAENTTMDNGTMKILNNEA